MSHSNKLTKDTESHSAQTSTGRAPILFVSHGSPMLAVDPIKGEPFKKEGQVLSGVKALVVVSAHWETDNLQIGTTKTQQLIYDFGGFADELYQVQYPAPGDLELAHWVQDQLTRALEHTNKLNLPLEIRNNSARGWDHGVWTPMVHLRPQADLAILQISLPRRSPADLFALGQALAFLSEQNVALLASGSATHNLRDIHWSHPQDSSVDEASPASRDFHLWLKDTLTHQKWNELINYQSQAPHARHNHPTPEHFTPLLIAAGAASSRKTAPRFFVETFEYKNLSRLSLTWD